MDDILQYNGYYASVNFSSADEVFYGKIIGINDLVNFEGSTVAELKQAFQEAVEDYLETCSEIGKSPDKTYKGSFNVRVPSSLHKQAAMFASVNQITLNEFVKTAIFYALKHKEDVNRAIQDDSSEFEAV